MAELPTDIDQIKVPPARTIWQEYIPLTPSPENEERPHRYEEAAVLTRDLSYLIADNNWSDGNRDDMGIVYLYPLHKKQVLQYIQNATGRDLRGFNEDGAFDEEFRTALSSTAQRLVSSASLEDHIADLWSVLHQDSHSQSALSRSNRTAKGAWRGRQGRGGGQGHAQRAVVLGCLLQERQRDNHARPRFLAGCQDIGGIPI